MDGILGKGMKAILLDNKILRLSGFLFFKLLLLLVIFYHSSFALFGSSPLPHLRFLPPPPPLLFPLGLPPLPLVDEL